MGNNPDVNSRSYHKYREERLYKAWTYSLKSKYGITEAQYVELLRQQNGSCGVCKRPAGDFRIRLSVDHDHKTGQVRGLLCTFCNRVVIGRHREPELFEHAAEYLRTPTEWFVPPKRKKKRKSKK